MSKTVFAGLSIVMLIIVVISVYFNGRYKERLRKSMAAFLASWVLALVSYSIVFFTEEYKYLSLGYSLFFLSMDWLCFTMLFYTIEYTRYKGKKFISFDKRLPYIAVFVLVLDSISMFCNVFFEHAVEYQVVYYRGERYLRYIQKPMYVVHLILCYIMIGMVMYLFVKRIRAAAKLYKRKYYMVMTILIMLVASDACVLIFKPVVNVTIFSYAIAALLIHYFTFYYIPHYLERYMQILAQNKQQDMIIMFDNQDHCIYMNGNASAILNAEKQINRENFEKFWEYTDDSKEIIVLEKNGTKQYFTREYEELSDEQGKYMGCFFVMHEITKEKELQEKYRYLATHDALTGLYNRTFFFEKAEEFMRRNPEEEYLIVCSDIRQFNTVNDIFGMETGDMILKIIAEQLKMDDDNNRIYGRIAGDSFALCIPKHKFEAMAPLFEKGNAMHVKNVNYPIMNHMGVYEVKDLSISVAAMCDRAMLAIDSIKNDMQKGVAYYNNEIREKILREKEILRDLIPAYEEEQFTIYFQPQISHSTGAVVGGEVLVRWMHPEKGIITPNVFIPLIENNGLISKLDQYIWRKACEAIKHYKEKGRKISLSVNISVKDFYYLDLYKEFMGLVQEYGIEPSQLKLEITESAVMIDVPKQVALIRKLQAEGFLIEMDDFGSGYSSLNTLKDIPVDILKLDLQFMGKAEDPERSANILQMVVGMAQKLHMPVIAEGVETKEQADFLGSIGCDIVQGYFYAKPMPMEEFDKLLEQYPYQELLERV